MTLRIFGSSGGRTMAVATEAKAVTIFASAESQNTGCHNVQISIRWVMPQAMMNTPKETNTQLKGSSRLARHTR
jgi:hypothetical protein